MLLDADVAPESCSAARAIGYRQALAQLHRWRDDASSITADSVVRLNHKINALTLARLALITAEPRTPLVASLQLRHLCMACGMLRP